MAVNRMSISFLAPVAQEITPNEPSSLSSPRDRDDVLPATIQGPGSITQLTSASRSTSHSYDTISTDQPGRGRNSTSPSSTSGDDPSGQFRRQPRSPRPTYGEEQRFFVMFARLIQEKSWPEIEDDFATVFNQRSRGGLCSLYYRIRRSWGLEDVLKSDSNYWALERRVVDEKASNFSQDFLVSIGYLQQ
jgi:hypothetical protein